MTEMKDGRAPEGKASEQIAYVSFSAEINPKTTESLLGLCADLSNKRTAVVYLLMSTPGGAVMNGLTVYNILRGMPFRLITHNVGSVNSIGNVIFLAGEERYCCRTATFMFHGVGFDVTQAARFEEKILRERLDGIQADQRRIAAVISERSGIPAQEVEALFLEAMTRDAEYAKARGLVHDIREVKIPEGASLYQLVFQR